LPSAIFYGNWRRQDLVLIAALGPSGVAKLAFFGEFAIRLIKCGNSLTFLPLRKEVSSRPLRGL
jgi:hypothetical protein